MSKYSKEIREKVIAFLKKNLAPLELLRSFKFQKVL